MATHQTNMRVKDLMAHLRKFDPQTELWGETGGLGRPGMVVAESLKTLALWKMAGNDAEDTWTEPDAPFYVKRSHWRISETKKVLRVRSDSHGSTNLTVGALLSHLEQADPELEVWTAGFHGLERVNDRAVRVRGVITPRVGEVALWDAYTDLRLDKESLRDPHWVDLDDPTARWRDESRPSTFLEKRPVYFV